MTEFKKRKQGTPTIQLQKLLARDDFIAGLLPEAQGPQISLEELRAKPVEPLYKRFVSSRRQA